MQLERSKSRDTTSNWVVPLALSGVAAAAVLIVDQVSKQIVLRQLGPDGGGGVVTIIPGVLRLLFVRNTGTAFGLFQGSSSVLRMIAIGAVVLLAVYYLRAARNDPLIATALGLQVGGAAGNIVDRFRHGYVIDWIDVPHWPTFNLADSAITVGVALLLFAMLFREHYQRREARSPAGPHPQLHESRGEEG